MMIYLLIGMLVAACTSVVDDVIGLPALEWKVRFWIVIGWPVWIFVAARRAPKTVVLLWKLRKSRKKVE